MKLFFRIALLITILCLSDCKSHQRFVVVNNSEWEIMMLRSRYSLLKDTTFIVHPETTPEDLYKEILMETRVKPNTSRSIDYWGDWMHDYPDTTFFGVFNIIDLDTMSLEEFKSKFPIKHEFKVTLQDMIDRDWTLVYPPYD